MKAPVTYLLIIAVLTFFALTTCSKLSINQNAPDVPSAPTPADGGTLDSVAIELSWTCSDPDGDPLSYDIYIDTSSTPDSLVATVDTTSYTPVGLRYNSTYYWQIVATDTTGLETAGPVWSFSFGADMIVPSCSLTAPNGGEFWYVGTDHDIEWEASDDDSIYFCTLEFSPDAGINWITIEDSIAGNPQIYTWTVPDSIYVSRCMVRVSCWDFGDNTASDLSDEIFTLWPQGGLIAFSTDRGGETSIFTMFSNGSNQQNLTSPVGMEFDFDPDWAPDGSQIVFRKYDDATGNNDIYIINIDGTGLINITNSPTTNDLYPVWSPLGDRIAFASIRGGTDWDIWLMDPDGSNLSIITSAISAHDSYPSWSPAGDQLVFHTNRDAGNYDIYKMDDNGGSPTRLTTHALTDAWPSWSPNGQLIAFVSYRDGGAAEIYTMNENGSNPLRRTTNAFTDWWPRWSPNGRILFMSNRSGDYEIWVMDADGSNPENLSNSLDWEGYASWSPIY